MLSTVEKVLILKTVSIFSKLPDSVLADIANCWKNGRYRKTKRSFIEGEPGDSMYIIVNGKVRVHADERSINYLENSEVFGEMALLDPEPHLHR